MKTTLGIIAFFVAGLVFGVLLPPSWIIKLAPAQQIALYALLFCVGVGVGADSRLKQLFLIRLDYLLVPLATFLGTFGGAFVYWKWSHSLSLLDTLAIAGGFGYYSLSSILISDYSNATAGTIALLTNIIRELMTILLAPVLVKIAGKYAVISSAGATSMDTSLPFIIRYAGNQYTFLAIFHGILFTILVPIIIGLIYQLS